MSVKYAFIVISKQAYNSNRLKEHKQLGLPRNQKSNRHAEKQCTNEYKCTNLGLPGTLLTYILEQYISLAYIS